MNITLTIDLPAGDADSIVRALDTIATDLIAYGYADAEWYRTPVQANGVSYLYRIERKTNR